MIICEVVPVSCSYASVPTVARVSPVIDVLDATVPIVIRSMPSHAASPLLHPAESLTVAAVAVALKSAVSDMVLLGRRNQSRAVAVSSNLNDSASDTAVPLSRLIDSTPTAALTMAKTRLKTPTVAKTMAKTRLKTVAMTMAKTRSRPTAVMTVSRRAMWCSASAQTTVTSRLKALCAFYTSRAS